MEAKEEDFMNLDLKRVLVLVVPLLHLPWCGFVDLNIQLAHSRLKHDSKSTHEHCKGSET